MADMQLVEAHAWNEFIELRKKVNDCILWMLERCDAWNYEGTWEVLFDMPDTIEDPKAIIPMVYCRITLYSRLICPHSRRCEWRGRTFSEALERCKSDVDSWIEKIYFDG